MTNRNKQKGFSLVEALVVVAVLAVISIVMIDLLSRTIKGGNKTELIGDLKQNGQSALDNLDTSIRSADKVICTGTYNPSTAQDTFKDAGGNNLPDTIVIAKDGAYTRFRFYFEKTSPATNGYIGQTQLIADPVNVNSGLCANPPVNATANPSTDLKLTPDNGLISVKGGTFDYTKSINLSYKDVVGIRFDLGSSVNNSRAFDQQSGNVRFSTTVELR